MNRNLKVDILIVGGGTGGVAAAMAATTLGLSVALSEEFPWLAGQLTSQLVPPDEHRWIESFGSTKRYREFRNRVRDLYRTELPLTDSALAEPNLNPGGGWVSRLCFEPRIGWIALQQMLLPALSSGNLHLIEHSIPIEAHVNQDKVEAVIFRNVENQEITEVEARWFLDATETGDLLPLAGIEYRTGAESKAETGEPQALDIADPAMMQGITWCAVFGYDDGSHRVIDKPAQYEFCRDLKPANWPTKIFDFEIINPITGAKRTLPLFPSRPEEWGGLFTYRQIRKPEIFTSSVLPATVVNWPQNDYYLKPVVDVPQFERALNLEEARNQTFSLLYWLQTEAPRHDGGVGYPGLFLCPELAGTMDGLAQAPYIRESRRIKACFTITEQMVSQALNPGLDRAQPMPHSVGVGHYPIDIHPCTNGGPTLEVKALPFQIPLGALVPERVTNVLAAAKNIGTTHITNGCYRLHPVEWNIGESAGLVAGFCALHGYEPCQLLESGPIWADFERLLHSQGIETSWPADLG